MTALRHHHGLGRAAGPLRGPRPRLRPARGLRARRRPLRRAVASRRPRSLPTCRRTCVDAATLQLAARPGARVRPGGAARRDAARRRRSTPPKAAPCCTPRCARRAAPGPFSDEVHGVLDAMLAYAETRARATQRHHRHRQHRHRRQRPRARRWWCRRCDAYAQPRHAAALRQQRRRPRHRAGAARLDARRDAVHRRQQDLHDAGDDGQRGGGARLVPGAGRHRHRAPLRRRHHQRRRRRPRSASPPPSASGTGWAGAIRCGARSACRSPSPSAPSNFRALLAGAHAMDRHFAEAPLEQQPAGAAGAARRLVPQLPRLHAAAAWRPTTRA